MTTTELEQVIRDLILDIYGKLYVGKIKVIKLDPVGYSVHLGMSTPEKPMIIYAELEDAAYLKFLRLELKDKRFNLVYFGELRKLYPYDCYPRNTKCGCND